MDIFSIFSLLGGLALFLYGMNVMGNSLEKLAGGRFEKILETLTSNPIRGVLLGLGVTAIIQSSSATTVMVVGFVNSGIMKLSQAVGIIMGANVGTTVTSWLLSTSSIQGTTLVMRFFKPSTFTPILAFIGLLLTMVPKSTKKRDLGTILIGFAVLMFGMDQMSGAVEGLANVPEFTNILLLFSNPVFGVLAGALLTAIIQSSSASVGILQALSATGKITFGSAIPIILGQNIGTCITAIISCIGANNNAKRAAVVHLYFNIIGTLLFLVLFYVLNAVIDFAFVDSTVNAVGIAIVHTIFNLLTTLVLLPFAKVLEKLSYLTIRDKDEVVQQFHLLDDRFLQTPSFAIEQCRTVTQDMCDLSRETIQLAFTTLKNYSEKTAQAVLSNEKRIDKYEDKIGSYIVRLSSQNLYPNDSASMSLILHAIGDFERISDHAVNILEAAQEMNEKKLEFSPEGKREMGILIDATGEILDLVCSAFKTGDLSIAYKVEPLEEVIDALTIELRNRHVRRLQKGQCTIEIGFVFTDLLTNLERVADHCSGLAVTLIQGKDQNAASHQYLKNVKKTDATFMEKFEQYSNKYML